MQSPLLQRPAPTPPRIGAPPIAAPRVNVALLWIDIALLSSPPDFGEGESKGIH